MKMCSAYRQMDYNLILYQICKGLHIENDCQYLISNGFNFFLFCKRIHVFSFYFAFCFSYFFTFNTAKLQTMFKPVVEFPFFSAQRKTDYKSNVCHKIHIVHSRSILTFQLFLLGVISN